MLDTLRILVSTDKIVPCSHVRWDMNKVEDILSNLGAEGGRDRIIGTMEEFRNENWAHNYSHLYSSNYEIR